MDLFGFRDSITWKFLFAVTVQALLVLLFVTLAVVFLGPELVLGSITGTQFAIVGAVFVLACLAFANTVLVARRDILDPVVEMRAIADEIARGNLEARPTRPFQVDETGDLERAFLDLHEYLTAVAAQAAALRNERFDDDAFDESIPGELGVALEEMRASLRDAIRERDRELARNERALCQFQRVASDADRDFDEKLSELLAIGRERLGVGYGYVAAVDLEAGHQRVVAMDGAHERLSEGDVIPLERAYCRRTVDAEGLVAFERPADWPSDPGHEAVGFGCYIGQAIYPTADSEEGTVRTICFGDDDPREFTEAERRFIELLALWASHERQRETRISNLRTFKKAVERAGNPIYWTDADERIQYVNPAFEATTGYDAETVRDRTPRLLQSGEHDEEFYANLWETILSGEDWQAEMINERRDGDRFVVDQTITPVVDETGTVEHFVAVSTEMTDRKKREQALRERRRELEILRQVLIRVLRHNVRTELNVIKGTAERIDAPTDDLEGIAATIAESADNLERVTENAYAIATLTERNEAARRYDLASTVRDAVDSIESRAPETTVRTDLPEECVVDGADGLDLAIYNLVENAVEHNTAPDPEVRVTIERTDGVRLVVEDNGPGIPDQEVDVLRAGEETQLRHGSGAGLWLAKWVVEYSGGRLQFPETDDGTRVRIDLPNEGTADGYSRPRRDS